MRLRPVVLACLSAILLALPINAQTQSVAVRLGYPADSKLLIIHADDLAVAHSVDSASFEALEKGAVTSASIMMPCPWTTEVGAYAKAHSDADLGLHLTLTSEWTNYRWGSVESKDKVPSLLDPVGTFWMQAVQVASNAKAAEAALEFRAQVQKAIAMGIHPTHLDTHMGTAFATPEIFAAYAKVAHEFHLPFLVARFAGGEKFLSALSEKDVALDSVVIVNLSVAPGEWKQSYLNAIRNLKPGFSEMIVHLGHDDAELETIMGRQPFGADWRQRDFDVVTSPEFKQALRDNNVLLVKWKDLQKLVN